MVEEATRDDIERLNVSLEGTRYKIGVVSVDEFEFLEKNAHYMPNEMFRNLVDNVKRDGALTSVPLCLKTKEGKYRVLSGNHRAMAAKEAGLKTVIVLYTDEEMSRSEQVAIQLSHNAINGKDDPVILKSLWDEIEDLSQKYYSGLDDKVMDELQKVELPSLSEVGLDFASMSFVFIPEEKAKVDSIMDKIKEFVSASDESHFAKYSDFSRLVDALTKVMNAYNTRNSAVCLSLILDIFERHYVDLQNGWLISPDMQGRTFVPFASVNGSDNIPLETAKKLKRVIDKLIGGKKIKGVGEYWKAIDYMADSFLGGE